METSPKQGLYDSSVSLKAVRRCKQEGGLAKDNLMSDQIKQYHPVFYQGQDCGMRGLQRLPTGQGRWPPHPCWPPAFWFKNIRHARQPVKCFGLLLGGPSGSPLLFVALR